MGGSLAREVRPAEGVCCFGIAEAYEEEAFAVLWDQRRRVEHLHSHVIPRAAQLADDVVQRMPSIDVYQIWNIFEDEHTRLLRVGDADDLVEEVTALILQTLLRTRPAEGLAREP